MLVDELSAAIRSIIQIENAQFSEFVANRLSAESWLQLRVLDHLGASVQREYPYPTNPLGRRHVDFWKRETDGTESWIELKTCITNYDRKFGTVKGKPITVEITLISNDIDKLKSLEDKTAHRFCLVLAYPLPKNYRSHRLWQQHLDRLRTTAILDQKFESPVVYEGQQSLAVAYTLKV